MASILELGDTVAAVAARAGASVAGIAGRRGHGTGFVIAKDRILTNAHNLREAETVVTFSDGRTETATAAAADPDADLAVLTVATGESEPLRWSGAEAAIGTPVFALANPGGRGLRVTFGLVSAVQRSFRGPRGRRIRGAIEHTAPLLPGSSGGPVVDVAGAVVGVNTNRLGEGFYLAVPSDASLRAAVENLSRGEAPRRARLGIGIAPANVARRLRHAVGLPDAEGLLVMQVEDGSPAAAAGLGRGDLIVAAGGSPVGDLDALYAAVDAAGETLALSVLRGAERREATVPLGASS